MIRPERGKGVRGTIRITLCLVVLLATSWNAGLAMEVLEGDNAIVYYDPDNRPLAERVADIMRVAEAGVAEFLGPSRERVSIYIHATEDDMRRGLREKLALEEDVIAALLRVGITARMRNMLHLNAALPQWDDTALLEHAIVDEHSQGTMEERFGPGPAMRATWIEEGLSSYVAHAVLRDRSVEYQREFIAWRYRVAVGAVFGGRLPALSDIDTRAEWFANIRRNRQAWNAQYATAFVSVNYLVDNWGFEAVLDVLDRIRAGASWQAALRQRLAITPAEFEDRVRRALWRQGLFVTYWKRAALATGTLALVLAVVTIRVSRRSCCATRRV